MKQQRDGLDRLAQTHVIGQTRAQSPAAHKGQPRGAALLIGAQLAHKGLRRLDLRLLRAGPHLLDKIFQRPGDLHAGHRQPAHLVGGFERQVQRLAEFHLARPPLLPEVNRGLDLLRLEQHPLAAHANQGLFQRHQPLELLAGERLAAQGQFPIEAHQRIEAEDALADDVRLGFEAGLGAHAEPRARLLPPGRHQDAEAAALQQGADLAQEIEGLIDGQGAGLGPRGAQTLQNRREEPRRRAQSGQHVLLRALEAIVEVIQRAAARVPDLIQRDQQAGIVVRLQQIAQDPLGAAHAPALLIHIRRLQTETEAERRFGGAAQLIEPLLPYLVERDQIAPLLDGHLDDVILGPERRPPRAGDPFRRLASAIQTIPAPIADRAIHQLGEEALQQIRWIGGLVGIGVNIGREGGATDGGHCLSQRAEARAVAGPVEERLPAGAIDALVLAEHGEVILAGQHLQPQLGDGAPVAQIAAPATIARRNRHQQIQRRERIQRQRGHAPGGQGRRGVRRVQRGRQPRRQERFLGGGGQQPHALVGINGRGLRRPRAQDRQQRRVGRGVRMIGDLGLASGPARRGVHRLRPEVKRTRRPRPVQDVTQLSALGPHLVGLLVSRLARDVGNQALLVSGLLDMARQVARI